MTSYGAPFSNVARNLRQLRHAPGSWAVAVAIVLIHAAVGLYGGVQHPPAVRWYDIFALSRDGLLSGKIWQLFSYGLLHGGWQHAGINAAFVLLIGCRIEHMAGTGVMLRTVLVGICAGGVAHFAFAASGSGTPLLVGLSGGCMALLLLLTTLSPQSRMMPLPVSAGNLGLGLMATEFIFALLDPKLGLPGFSLVGEALIGNGWSSWLHVSHTCHLGGGMAGWGIGRWLLRPRITLKRLRADRERREASEFRKPD